MTKTTAWMGDNCKFAKKGLQWGDLVSCPNCGGDVEKLVNGKCESCNMKAKYKDNKVRPKTKNKR